MGAGDIPLCKSLFKILGQPSNFDREKGVARPFLADLIIHCTSTRFPPRRRIGGSGGISFVRKNRGERKRISPLIFLFRDFPLCRRPIFSLFFKTEPKPPHFVSLRSSSPPCVHRTVAGFRGVGRRRRRCSTQGGPAGVIAGAPPRSGNCQP